MEVHNIIVDAKSGGTTNPTFPWIDTGIDLLENHKLSIEATGQVSPYSGGNHWSGPDGNNNLGYPASWRPDLTSPQCALIGCIVPENSSYDEPGSIFGGDFSFHPRMTIFLNEDIDPDLGFMQEQYLNK